MQALEAGRHPLAAQVRDGIADAIRTGELRPGQQMPGERELAERLAVGRSTLREPLRLLERNGLVDVFHGRGRFVSALATLHADRPVTEFESVTEMLEGLGYTESNRVLRVEQASATEGTGARPGVAARRSDRAARAAAAGGRRAPDLFRERDRSPA